MKCPKCGSGDINFDDYNVVDRTIGKCNRCGKVTNFKLLKANEKDVEHIKSNVSIENKNIPDDSIEKNKISKDIDVQKMIVEECDKIKNLLLEKNKAYGNSAIEPLRIFSKLDNIEQIKVRIDDKLSRINKAAKTSIQEDTEQDLIGYLVLLRICKKIEGKK